MTETTVDSDAEFKERMRRVESLVREIEESPDAIGRERSRELVHGLLELHAAGLARMIEAARAHEGPGAGLVETWTRESTVASLLLLHGIHPTPLDRRVRAALEPLDGRLRTLGARVTLFEMAEDAVRLRIEVAASGGHVNATAVRTAVEDALCAGAPDAELHLSVVLLEPMPQGFIPVAQLLARRP